jgi:hypothetical protein
VSVACRLPGVFYLLLPDLVFVADLPALFFADFFDADLEADFLDAAFFGAAFLAAA